MRMINHSRTLWRNCICEAFVPRRPFSILLCVASTDILVTTLALDILLLKEIFKSLLETQWWISCNDSFLLLIRQPCECLADHSPFDSGLHALLVWSSSLCQFVLLLFCFLLRCFAFLLLCCSPGLGQKRWPFVILRCRDHVAMSKILLKHSDYKLEHLHN